MPFPDPSTIHPIRLQDGTRHKGTVFLNAILDHPRMHVGDYTYMSAHEPLEEPAQIAAKLAPYLYDFAPERLVIGKFCQIAAGAQFITSSANHRYDGLSSFPFLVFGGGWENRPSLPEPGADTIIGHDVWIGADVKVLPGAVIGDGAIIGAGAVVSGTVDPYTIVAGNPAKLVRRRLSKAEALEMQRIAWWDWPIQHIVAHEAEICGCDIAALAAVVPANND